MGKKFGIENKEYVIFACIYYHRKMFCKIKYNDDLFDFTALIYRQVSHLAKDKSNTPKITTRDDPTTAVIFRFP